MKKISLMAISLSGTSMAYAQQTMSDKAMNLTGEQVDIIKNLFNIAVEFLVKYSFQVLGGIIILIVGWIIGGIIAKYVLRFLQNKKIDITIAKFIASAVKFAVMVFAAIIAVGKFGIEIAPFIAGISVIGVGIGLAMQGLLSNYAAGISLIFTKPFKVGDIIEVANQHGEVLDIKLARTDLKTVDGTVIVIPNKHIIGEIIHNFTDFKLVDINVGIGYKSDYQKAIRLVFEIIKNDVRIDQKRTPKVGIKNFGDSSLDLYARLWCKQDIYWEVLFDLNKKIFDAFQKEGIAIPFPQRDVRIIKE